MALPAPGTTASSVPPTSPPPSAGRQPGAFQAARRWLQQQPPALRYTIVGVFVVLGTLESSFWLYNGYLRLQRHQADKQQNEQEAANEAPLSK